MPQTGNKSIAAAPAAQTAAPSRFAIKVLTLCSVFPSAPDPLHGTFVFERARAVAKLTPVRVIAPLSWIRSGHRDPIKRLRQIRRYEEREGLRIWHPWFFYVPRILKPLDGLFMFLSVLSTVRSVRKTAAIDLLDVHFAHPEGSAGVLLKKLFKIPLVITLRGTLISDRPRGLRRRVIAWSLRRADRIIAVAAPLAAEAVAMGVDSARVDIIPNGVDASRFPMVARDVARERLGWAVTGRIIIAIGHLSPVKRFHLVIDALSKLPPDISLIIIGGPGPDRNVKPVLLEQIKRLGLETRCRLTGPMAQEQVALAVNAANVFVLASETEGSPNALMEALAAGTPAVASRVGEVERFVQEGANGLLFDAGDGHLLAAKIEAALARDWNRDEIRRSVVSRDWSCVAREVLDTFCLAFDEHARENLLQSRTPAPEGSEPRRR